MIRHSIRILGAIAGTAVTCWLLFQNDPVSLSGLGGTLSLPFGASILMTALGFLTLLLVVWGVFKLTLLPRQLRAWKAERREKQIRPFLEGAMAALSFKMPNLSEALLGKVPAVDRDHRYQMLTIMGLLLSDQTDQARLLLDQGEHTLSPVVKDLCRGHLALKVRDWHGVYTFWKRVHGVAQTPESLKILFSALLHLDNFAEASKLLKKNTVLLDVPTLSQFQVHLALAEAAVLEKRGKMDAGFKVLFKAFDQWPHRSEVAFTLLEGLLTTGKTDGAFTVWHKAWRRRPCLTLYLFAERLKTSLDPQKMAELESTLKNGGDWWALLHSLKQRMAWPAACEAYVQQLSPQLRQDVEQARRLAKRGAFELAWLYLMGDACTPPLQTTTGLIFKGDGLIRLETLATEAIPPTCPSLVGRRMVTEGLSSIISPAIIPHEDDLTAEVASKISFEKPALPHETPSLWPFSFLGKKVPLEKSAPPPDHDGRMNY